MVLVVGALLKTFVTSPEAPQASIVVQDIDIDFGILPNNAYTKLRLGIRLRDPELEVRSA